MDNKRLLIMVEHLGGKMKQENDTINYYSQMIDGSAGLTLDEEEKAFYSRLIRLHESMIKGIEQELKNSFIKFNHNLLDNAEMPHSRNLDGYCEKCSTYGYCYHRNPES